MSLVETSIALVVATIATAASLRLFVAAATTADRGETLRAATAIVASIEAHLRSLPYADPRVDSTTIGLDGSEGGGGPQHWNDADDADGWSGEPLGVAAGSGWIARIEVDFVSATNASSLVGSDQGLKRVLVSIERRGRGVLVVGFVVGDS
jgi:hypothetical protein